VEIGDMLNTPDHTLIVYDIITDNNGNKVDAILIHSMSGSGVRYIRIKVPRYYTESPKGDEYKNEYYTIFLKEMINTKFEESVTEATLNAVNLSKYFMWCDLTQPPKASNYTIIRPIHVNDKSQPIFKFIKSSEDHYKSKYKDNDTIELTKQTLDRIKFKHLYIEKLVNVKNNNIVEIGDIIIYKIIIKNLNKNDYNDELIIKEFLSKYVTFESYNEHKDNISFDFDMENKKLEWNISKLKKGER
jgi:uncharacterized repeat protein (TIGR01451 family)